jgi:hypothetical protein
MNPSWKQWVFRKAERILSRASSPLPYKEMAWKAVKFTVACGASNPFSFALRPLASYKHLRRVVGLNLALLALVAAAWGPAPSMASDTGGVPTMVMVSEGAVKISTEESVAWPIPSRDISQKYWLIHSGIDIRTPVGTPVNPIMRGKVVEIEVGKFGYGLKAVVDHRNGYRSLYAHLSRINSAVGDEVTTDSVIGWSGNTGRSTGPHLHLEIHSNGKPINPLLVLGNK